MDIIGLLTKELQIKKEQVQNTVKLIEEGNTIPFIARYRKELTGGLSDEILRTFHERYVYLTNLEARKEQVLKSIEEQGKLTQQLKKQIDLATTATQVEDLYLPYRPKKRTRATIAKEKGLEPLAKIILEQKESELLLVAAKYINEEKEVKTAEEALAGAGDILAEMIADNAEYRSFIRSVTFNKGILVSKAKDKETQSVYEAYYEYEEPVKKIPGHRILAINRGEKEKMLSIKIEAPVEEILGYLAKQLIQKNNTDTTILKAIVEDSYKRLIAPAIERDIRNQLTETAEDGALEVFKKNLHQLLMQAPIKGHCVMGMDPGYRTGCKIAVIDETGKKLANTVVFLTMSEKQAEDAKEKLTALINQYNVDLIAIGNGTASRETEKFTAQLIKELPQTIHYVIVNEAGASVYSASELATKEFPQDDVGTRSAVSIARRLQDPLAELVKIDPKAIGVGQYQHDMNQKKLAQSLAGVVEGTVNQVGVDLNTASASLLEYVAGMKKAVATAIVAYREENGAFTARTQLKKVKGLGPKLFEQCAGFLRITDGKNFLDRTAVHPESYDIAHQFIESLGYQEKTLQQINFKDIHTRIGNMEEIASSLGTGVLTLKDILEELEKPGRDPRDEMPKPILHSEILEIKDLKEGMKLKGTVRNIVDFGAFVDIGVHQDGLVHLSQMSERFIKHPLEVVKVGDIIDVTVLSVDINRQKISLTMKNNK